jgi:hypothetical protein
LVDLHGFVVVELNDVGLIALVIVELVLLVFLVPFPTLISVVLVGVVPVDGPDLVGVLDIVHGHVELRLGVLEYGFGFRSALLCRLAGYGGHGRLVGSDGLSFRLGCRLVKRSGLGLGLRRRDSLRLDGLSRLRHLRLDGLILCGLDVGLGFDSLRRCLDVAGGGLLNGRLRGLWGLVNLDLLLLVLVNGSGRRGLGWWGGERGFGLRSRRSNRSGWRGR